MHKISCNRSCLHFVKTGDLIFRNETDTFVRRAALFFVHPDDPGLFLNFGWRGFAIRANKMYPPQYRIAIILNLI